MKTPTSSSRIGHVGGSFFLITCLLYQTVLMMMQQPLLCDCFVLLSPFPSLDLYYGSTSLLYSLKSSKQDKSSNDDDHQNNQQQFDVTTMNRRSVLTTTATATASSLLLLSSPALTRRRSTANAADVVPDSDANNDNILLSTTTWTLDSDHNNIQMPKLALNTVGLSIDETELAIRLAVVENSSNSSMTTTHIDFHPGNERDGVAKYLKNHNHDIDIDRSKLFLNTKIRKAKPGTSAIDAAQQTKQQIDDDLKALNVPYVDMLMLRDSPDCDVIQAQWKVLEDTLKSGKTKSIGVINFCQSALECVLSTCTIKPALNYYMLHIGMGNDPLGLHSFCDSHGIKTFAYGAVGEPGPNDELLNSNVIRRIAKSHNKSVEQVALRWVLQTGDGNNAVSVRPTLNFGLGTGKCELPECEDGIKGRASSYTWSLSEKEMKILDNLKSPNDNPTLFSSKGCPNSYVMPSTK